MAIAGARGRFSEPSKLLSWFRGLTLATAVATFGLVVLGGVVRVTDSGLGCPDWPLCDGGLLPPWETKALIEFSHRIVASLLVGPLVLATVVMSWVAYRRERWVVIPATVALVLLVVQGGLGGATVEQELSGSTVATHLAVGEGLLACLILLAVVAFRGPLSASRSQVENQPGEKFPLLMVASAVGIYAILMSGSVVTVTNATWACADWPLCDGAVFPGDRLPAIHMGHRLLAAIVGLFVLYTLQLGIRGRHRPGFIRYLSMGVTILFFAQVMVGAGTVWLTFPVEYRALHLAFGTAVWGSIALLVLVIYTAQPLSGRVTFPVENTSREQLNA